VIGTNDFLEFTRAQVLFQRSGLET
jgi:hypothetical protein